MTRHNRCAEVRLLGILLAVILVFSTVGDMKISAADTRDSTLEGVSIMFLGDSFLAGYEESEQKFLWTTLLDTEYGMVTYQNSVSGATMSLGENSGYVYRGTYDPIAVRSLPEENFDIIFVSGGMNDWYLCNPLADSAYSRDLTTYQGSLNILFDRLEATYPDALILFMTGWNDAELTNYDGVSMTQFHAAAIEVCGIRNIPCFRACDLKVSGIFSHSAAFRSKYFLSESDYFHLNEAGHRRFLPVIARWIEINYISSIS